jgi:hypothetical protein
MQIGINIDIDIDGRKGSYGTLGNGRDGRATVPALAKIAIAVTGKEIWKTSTNALRH